MKLKINKASDLNSISVLPPHTRRSNGASYASGPRTSQLRSQTSQQSFSQGISSQHGGAFSQISQSSLDEALTNDQRFFSQEQENSAKKSLCLPPTNHSRDESPLQISRSSSLTRKWNSASHSDQRCQVSEEMEHRIRLMETSLSRFGMVLDSIQSDVMQVNKGTKEVSMEAEVLRQKLTVQENTLQSMIKGQEEFKASLSGGFKSLSEQVSKSVQPDNLHEINSGLVALPEKLQAFIQKSQKEFCNTLIKEMQLQQAKLYIAGTAPDRKNEVLPIRPPRYSTRSAVLQEKVQPIINTAVPPKRCVKPGLSPKIEKGGWKSVKVEKTALTTNTNTNTNTASNKARKQNKIQKDTEFKIHIDSDEESDEGFCFLLKGNKTGTGNCLVAEVKEETERIMRNARRRKRQCRNTIIIN